MTTGANSTPTLGTVTDATVTGAIHRVSIPAEQQAAFIAAIDPTAPAGKALKQLTTTLDAKGVITITLAFAP